MIRLKLTHDGIEENSQGRHIKGFKQSYGSKTSVVQLVDTCGVILYKYYHRYMHHWIKHVSISFCPDSLAIVDSCFKLNQLKKHMVKPLICLIIRQLLNLEFSSQICSMVRLARSYWHTREISHWVQPNWGDTSPNNTQLRRNLRLSQNLNQS